MTRRLRFLWALHRHSSWRVLRRHPGRVAVVVAAIAIGAGAVVATGSLIESTLASFEASVRAVSGDADLRIANGFVGVAEDLRDAVARVPGVAAAGAILSSTVRVRRATSDTEPLLLVGVDLLGEDPVHRSALSREMIMVRDEADFVSRPDAVGLSRAWAEARGVDIGAEIPVETRAGRRSLYVAGMVEPGATPALAGGAVGVMDLPALQWLLRREGIVDAIDVALMPGADHGHVRVRLEEVVAGRAAVSAIGKGHRDIDHLLFNLRLILHIAGFMAIVVSFIVIHHAVSIFVSQRQAELDVVRSLGASKRGVAAMFASEALLLGSVGGAIGLAIGTALAAISQALFTSSVTTLYTDIPAQSFRVSRGYLVFGISLAVTVTLLATLPAALRRRDLGRAVLYATPRHERLARARRAAAAGVSLAAVSLALTALQGPSLAVDWLIAIVTTADVLLLAGVSLAAPVIVLALGPALDPLVRRTRSVLPRLAWRGVVMDPGRTAAVLAALVVGITYVVITIAVVGSLSAYVFGWVENSFRADLVVSGSGSTGILPSSPAIPRAVGDIVGGHPDVARVEGVRVVTQPYGDRWIVVAARTPESLGTSYPVRVRAGEIGAARRAMREGDGVVVSEHFAEKFDLGVADAVELRTPEGPARFRIAAIVEDFLTDLGTVFVLPETYARLWHDDAVNGFHVWLRPGAGAEPVRSALATALETACDCAVRTGQEFREGFRQMIDAAFQTAYALEAVAAAVVVISVMSFFLLTLGERRNEIRTLQAVGATRTQLVREFLLEAGGIGLLGSLLGIASGVLVSYRLVHSTMHASGGLRVDYILPLWTLPALVAGAITLCALAALPPILRFSQPGLAAQRETMDE